jgi:hypothetical protein
MGDGYLEVNLPPYAHEKIERNEVFKSICGGLERR